MKLFNWLKSFRNRAARRGILRRGGVGQRAVSAWRHFGITNTVVSPTVEGLEDRSLLTTIDLAALVAAQGTTIFGADANDQSGVSVSSAGDVNGDGFDDLLIGAFLADASGNAKSYAGDSYVIFGGGVAAGDDRPGQSRCGRDHDLRRGVE